MNIEMYECSYVHQSAIYAPFNDFANIFILSLF